MFVYLSRGIGNWKCLIEKVQNLFATENTESAEKKLKFLCRLAPMCLWHERCALCGFTRVVRHSLAITYLSILPGGQCILPEQRMHLQWVVYWSYPRQQFYRLPSAAWMNLP